MNKVIGVITARMTSTRLPGKVLKNIEGKPNFTHHVERMKCVEGLEGVFLATSKDPLNEELIEISEQLGCGWYAGAEEDVVERHIELCERENADAVLRVTCDCPLFDIDSASRAVRAFKDGYKDFIHVTNMSTIYGTLWEVISHKALVEVHKHYRGPAISVFIRENMDNFAVLDIEMDSDLCRPEYRLTVDYPVDLELIRQIYRNLYKGSPIALRDVYTWLDDNPEIAKINRNAEVKGCNLYVASLMEKPLYSILRSGNRHIILNEQKQSVDPNVFMEEIVRLFPTLKH